MPNLAKWDKSKPKFPGWTCHSYIQKWESVIFSCVLYEINTVDDSNKIVEC